MGIPLSRRIQFPLYDALAFVPLFQFKHQENAKIKEPETVKVLNEIVKEEMQKIGFEGRKILNQWLWKSEEEGECLFPLPLSKKGETGKLYSPPFFQQHDLPQSVYHSYLTGTSLLHDIQKGKKARVGARDKIKKILHDYVESALLETRQQEMILQIENQFWNSLSIQEYVDIHPYAESLRNQKVTNLQRLFQTTESPKGNVQQALKRYNEIRSRVPLQYLGKPCSHPSFQKSKKGVGEIEFKCSRCGIHGIYSMEKNECSIPSFFHESIGVEIIRTCYENREQKPPLDHVYFQNTLFMLQVVKNMEMVESVLKDIQKVQHEIQTISLLKDEKEQQSPLHPIFKLEGILSSQTFPPMKDGEDVYQWIERCSFHHPLTLSLLNQLHQKEDVYSLLIHQLVSHPEVVQKELEGVLEQVNQQLEEKNKNIVPDYIQLGQLSFSSEQLKHLLSFIHEMKGGFGIHTYADVLSGSQSSKMRQFGLIKNAFHGYLKQYTKSKVLNVLEDIENQQWAYRKGYDYPKFVLTEKGKKMLQYLASSKEDEEEKKKVFMEMPFEKFVGFLRDASVLEEWKHDYVKHHMKKCGDRGYQMIVEAAKKGPLTEETLPYFKQYLIGYYQPKYEVVLSFMVKNKKASKFGKLLQDVLSAANEGEMIVC